MKIGVIVHSRTGNTLSVAEKLKKRLSAAGHSVVIEQVAAVNDDQTELEKIQLSSAPDLSGYDALVFGAPVRGFSLSPVMNAYLSRGASLQGKKIGCFVTQFFPFPSMGGNRSIGQMKELCASKGGQVGSTGIVNWSGSRREKRIADTVEKLSRL